MTDLKKGRKYILQFPEGTPIEDQKQAVNKMEESISSEGRFTVLDPKIKVYEAERYNEESNDEPDITQEVQAAEEKANSKSEESENKEEPKQETESSSSTAEPETETSGDNTSQETSSEETQSTSGDIKVESIASSRPEPKKDPLSESGSSASY